MAAIGSLEIANFICRFGASKVMLDYFIEVVWPAFQASAYQRQTKSALFFISESKIVTIKKGQNVRSAIVGRFVKDTILKRTQVFRRDKGIVSDLKTLRSSPNGIFVLTLEDHKLFLYAESQFAPSLKEFTTSCQSFLRSSYRDFIKKMTTSLAQSNNLSEAAASKQARKSVPSPDLEMVELLSKKSIDELMGIFNLVKSLDIVFHLTNNELDNLGFFQDLRKHGEKTNSSKTTLRQANGDGLSKEEVARQVKVAATGNASVKIAGLDDKGDVLRGNTDNLKFTRNIGVLSHDLEDAAAKILDNFWDLAAEGEIVTANLEGDVSEKTKKILQRLKSKNE